MMTQNENQRFFKVYCVLPEQEINSSITVSFSSTIDLSRIEEKRARGAAGGQLKPSYTAYVAKALSIALAEFPYANKKVFRSPWRWGGPWLHSFKSIDITVAAERDIEGHEYVAFVDVLRNADQKSLAEIHQWLKELAQSTETNNLQWREMNHLIRTRPWRLTALLLKVPTWLPSWWERYRGAAVLISSPSKYGVERVSGSWAWPLGISFGLVEPKPIVREGELVVRPCFDFVMNFDRRVMAGGPAARFFKRVCDLLETGLPQEP